MKDLKKRLFLLHSFSGLGLVICSWIPFLGIRKRGVTLFDKTYSWAVVTKYPKNMDEKKAVKLLNSWDGDDKRDTLLDEYKRNKLILSDTFYSKEDHCVWKMVFKNEKSRKEFLTAYAKIVDHNKRSFLGFNYFVKYN